MFHVYPILMPWADVSRKVYREVGEFVRKRVTEAANAITEAESETATATAPAKPRRKPGRKVP